MDGLNKRGGFQSKKRIESFDLASYCNVYYSSDCFFITGELGTAVAIGSIEFFMKFVIYYAHERLWLKVR